MRIKIKQVILLLFSTTCLFAKQPLDISPERLQGETWEVNDFYLGKPNTPFMCLVQDVHCHEQVQYVIFDVIKHIKSQYDKNFGTVAVEGNAGKIDTSMLSHMRDTRLKEDMSKNLMKRGLMTGAEYYDVLYPKQVLLFGVEDLKLYNENLAQIKKGLFDDAVVEKEVSLLKIKNKDSKRIFYGRKMFQFERLRRRYQEEKKIDLETYLKSVIKLGDINKVELQKYTNINLFIRRQELVEKIDTVALKMETKSILQIVDQYLTNKEKRDLKSLIKNGIIPSKYSRFINILKKHNLKIDNNFKQFHIYSDFLKVEDQLDNIELYNELDQFVFFAMHKASKNIQEKEIIYLDRYTNLLADYLDNKVSSKQRVVLNYEINNFIKRSEKRYGEIKGARILSHFYIMKDFYDTAIKRNEKIIDNTLKVASPITVLVVGGFHTEGIQELLRAKGSGYVVFTPKIEGGVKESLSIYLDRMKEEEGL